MGDTHLPAGFSWVKDLELGSPEVFRLSQVSWPRFLLEESDIADPLLKFQISEKEFKNRFKVLGIRENSNHKLVAFIHFVLVNVDLNSPALPELGWRFSIHDASINSEKNAVSLVEAGIDPEVRGRGLSKLLIEMAKQETLNLGFRTIVAPVRPTSKSQFPLEPIDLYILRKNEEQKIFDPWLRTHVESGAQILNICRDSVCVKATLPKWREWTQLQLDQSGMYTIAGGLVPLEIDVVSGIGIYNEPNIWVRYDLDVILSV